MFFCSGLSNYNITLFHLFNHAFFKALLFLGAGSIISSLMDEQHMRRMGSMFNKFSSIQENNFYILIPLFILSILSIFIGYWFSDIFIGVGSVYLNDVIFINYNHFNNIEAEFLSPLIKNMPLLLTFLGMFLGYIFFYYFDIKLTKIVNMFLLKTKIYEFFFNAGFFNFIYNFIYIFNDYNIFFIII